MPNVLQNLNVELRKALTHQHRACFQTCKHLKQTLIVGLIFKFSNGLIFYFGGWMILVDDLFYFVICAILLMIFFSSSIEFDIIISLSYDIGSPTVFVAQSPLCAKTLLRSFNI